MIRVRPAHVDDLDQWLRISREVEPLFGPMPDIRQHIERGIARGTALLRLRRMGPAGPAPDGSSRDRYVLRAGR